MCARYVSKASAEWERWFSIRKTPQFASFNVAPSQIVPVIRAGEGGNECELMRFGMIPYFTRGEVPRFATVNAKVENLQTNASWRGPWQRAQRCIVPANGFYDWHVLPDGRTKQPYYIRLSDREAFGFAALWDAARKADGSIIRSFAIITLPASPLMARIHNGKGREPAILTAEDQETWLRGSAEAARVTLRQCPEELLRFWPIGTRVNSPDNNDPALLEPVQGQLL
jgi:putative SOS response-associated peptidase YedK